MKTKMSEPMLTDGVADHLEQLIGEKAGELTLNVLRLAIHPTTFTCSSRAP